MREQGLEGLGQGSRAAQWGLRRFWRWEAAQVGLGGWVGVVVVMLSWFHGLAAGISTKGQLWSLLHPGRADKQPQRGKN